VAGQPLQDNRTGHPGQVCLDRPARTGQSGQVSLTDQPGQVSQERFTGIGLRGQDGHNMTDGHDNYGRTARTTQQDSGDGAARTIKEDKPAGQFSLDRSALSWDRTTGIRQLGQDNTDRTWTGRLGPGLFEYPFSA
jgi:hypothetical protein